MRSGKRHVPSGAFAQVIKAFLQSDKFARLGKGTQYNWKRWLTLADSPEGLGSVPVDEMRPALVQAYLDGLTETPGAQQTAYAALRALNKWARVRDLLPQPIVERGMELVGSEGGHEPWTDEQTAFAESTVSPHLSRVLTLAANTGQRGSDLVKMRWTDLEVHDGHPGINVHQVKKTKTGRMKLWIPFTQALIAKIDTWERSLGFILVKRDGTPFANSHQLTNHWLKERKRPELQSISHLHLHGLRATAVVRLRRANIEPTLIANFVGMSVGMVERYCRLSDQRENALAAVRILDGQILRFPQDKALK